MSKILFKMWKFPRVSETFMIAQFKTAVKSGFEIDILIQDPIGEKNSFRNILQENDLNARVYTENSMIADSKFIRIFKLASIFAGNLKYIKSFLRVLFAERKKGLDLLFQFQFYKKFKDHEIIHVQYGTNAKPLDLLKRYGLIKNKVVTSFHGHDAFFPINNRIFDRDYYKILFEYGELFIANTPYLKEQLLRVGCPDSKIEVIPVGVDVKTFKPTNLKNDPDSFRIITIGRLNKVKGHSYAIEAIKLLKEEGYKVIMTIAGEGPLRNELQLLMEKYNLQDCIELAGWMNHEQIKSLLGKNDIYLSTSMPVKSERRETQGLANIEAQACGLPVIAFDSGGVKYTIADTISGFLINEGDIKGLKEKIELLIKDENLRTRMGEAAVEFVKKNYAQDVLDRKWDIVYKSLMER